MLFLYDYMRGMDGRNTFFFVDVIYILLWLLAC